MLILVLLALPLTKVVADKVYLKDGKSLDGIVEAEYPTRIKFNFQGRGMFIERSRIDRIEKSDNSKNADMLIIKAEDALAAGNGNEAVGILIELGKIENLTPEQKAAVDEMTPRAASMAEMGTPEERREKSLVLVKQAAEHFDKIETREAIEALFKALELDPTSPEGHAEMSRLFDTPSPDLNLAASYFGKYVDAEKLDGEHKVIPLLPKVFEAEAVRMQEATDPAAIESHIRCLQKLNAAFEVRPAWVLPATEAQKALIAKGSFGIVTLKVDQALEKENYPEALIRLQALGGEKDRPELTNLYTSVYMGLGEFDKARALLEFSKTQAADPASVDRVLNALNIYTTAMDAQAREEHKEARQAFDLLFEQQAEIPREILSLVAKAKVGYDITLLESREAEENYQEAANVAVLINSYSRDKNALQLASDVFSRVAPHLTFKPVVTWIVDEVEIPLSPEWTDIVKNDLTNRFEIHFDDASSFALNVRIIQESFNAAGPKILEATNNPDAYTIDYLTQDTSIVKMTLEFVISHPSNPELTRMKHEVTGLSKATIQARETAGADLRHQKDKIVYLDLTSVSEFGSFLSEELGNYYPPELAVMAGQIKLRPKMLDE